MDPLFSIVPIPIPVPVVGGTLPINNTDILHTTPHPSNFSLEAANLCCVDHLSTATDIYLRHQFHESSYLYFLVTIRLMPNEFLSTLLGHPAFN